MNEILKISSTSGIQKVKIEQLIPENNKRLRQKSIDWDFTNPPENALEFARTLINTCKAYGGLGLSAIQIGKPYRVFCIGLIDTFQICFNPKIIETSKVTIRDDEGCLSFPGLVLKIERSNEIQVEFQLPDGSIQNHTFVGLTARCFSHEMDHLDGVVFSDRVGDMSLRLAKERRKKFIKQVQRRRKQRG